MDSRTADAATMNCDERDSRAHAFASVSHCLLIQLLALSKSTKASSARIERTEIVWACFTLGSITHDLGLIIITRLQSRKWFAERGMHSVKNE